MDRSPITQQRLTRRDLLRRGGVGAGALFAASALGGLPAGATAFRDVASDGLRFARVWPQTVRQALALAAFDDTHNVHADGSMDLLLWPGDLTRLKATGAPFELFSPSPNAMGEGRPSGLPLVPGEVPAYRRLPDYNTDLQTLATGYPTQAKMIEMGELSLEGRKIYGIEIADDWAKARTDGRPTFFVDGVHHAREWPSSEFSLMFAFDLLQSYAAEDVRVRDLLSKIRVVVVPIVNVDGFNHSREHPVENPNEGAVGVAAYWRKNKRSVTGLLYPTGPLSPLRGAAYGHENADAHGTDPNRNYPFYWGGEGGGSDPTSQTYGGAAPYAEPESRNIANLMKSMQVTAYLTNHTSGRLCMRPWGYTNRPSPDSDLQIDLGADMIATQTNKYKNQIGLSLYPTAGTSRDWSYGALRTIVYTFEHLTAFHPSYTTNIPNGYAKDNREAWMILAAAAANPANHGIISGRAVDAAGAPVAGAVIELTRTFKTPTAVEVDAKVDGGVQETILSRALTRADGTFDVHANPSTRPTTIQDGRPDEYWTVNIKRDAATAPGSTHQVFLDRGTVAPLGDVRA